MTINIITGGSRGLGRAMALQLADKGQDSIITYRSRRADAEAVLKEIEAKGRRAAAIEFDAGDTSRIPGFADAIRKTLHDVWRRDSFDHLVNNAGHGMDAPIAALTEPEFDDLMRVHLKAPFFLTQALLPLMADGGRIINVSSGLARFALPNRSAYGMMKGGIEVFTRYLAKELGPRRITANTVAPGAIATDFGGGVVRDNPQVNAALAGQTALGRVGEADDIGALVAAMLTEDFRWVNGQRIEASGGIFL